MNVGAGILDVEPEPSLRRVVLLVDDEKVMLRFWRDALADEGWHVLTAANGREALRIAEREDVSVILSDHMMPELTGLELFEHLEKVGHSAVRVLCTGLSDAKLMAEALNRGNVYRLLLKPVQLPQFRACLRQAMDCWLLTRENQALRRNAEGANRILINLLHTLPFGVLVVGGTEKTIMVANEAAGRSLGVGAAELLGRPAADAGVPARLLENLAAGVQGLRNVVGEVVDSRGILRTLLWTCSAMQRPGSSELASLLLSFEDITEKQELVNTVFLAKQEIESIFDSITDATYLVDRSHRIARANRALAVLTKKPFHEVLGKRCDELSVEGENLSWQNPLVDRVFATGEPAHAERRVGPSLLKVHCFPVQGAGLPTTAVVRLQDVTGERELADRLVQSEKLASIGQISAGIAHEINNPVGYILSNFNRLTEFTESAVAFSSKAALIARRALDGSADPLEAWREYWSWRDEADMDYLLGELGEIMAECKEGAERIRGIVVDLKNFSRSEQKAMQYADLNQGLESTTNIVWNELKYKCEVVKDYGVLPPLLCYPQQLNQVFLNLLVNAGQAIENRGVITLRTQAGDGEILVSISDTGQGIAPEHLKRIFDPFFTTKPVGKGTGLGLHVAFGIVQAHGGEIRVESTLGKGSTFTVRLPIQPPPTTTASPSFPGARAQADGETSSPNALTPTESAGQENS